MNASHPLSDHQIQTVKQTIPLLESAGTAITEHFYARLFRHHPELQDIFNMSNQRSGRQQFALFSAIAAYAKNIENLDVLHAAVERIANKHTSLRVLPEHYPIVGEHLIATLKELAPDAFTAEVESAWTAAYALLASVFIGREEGIYKDNANKNGGWEGGRNFKLVEKRIESELVKSFIFEPVDGAAVCDYQPGQYLGIKLNIPGQDYEEIRQYSLSDKPNGVSYRISVKREILGTPGIVSNFLHDGLRLGDTVELRAPVGDFFYQNRNTATVLISAGVGLTPMQSVLETIAAANNEEPVFYLHACESVEQHSFRRRNLELGNVTNLCLHTWYKNDHSEQKNIHHGFMDLLGISDELPLEHGNFYLCGPLPFMQFAKQQLLTLGVDSNRVHYEVFGPHEDF